MDNDGFGVTLGAADGDKAYGIAELWVLRVLVVTPNSEIDAVWRQSGTEDDAKVREIVQMASGRLQWTQRKRFLPAVFLFFEW